MEQWKPFHLRHIAHVQSKELESRMGYRALRERRPDLYITSEEKKAKARPITLTDSNPVRKKSSRYGHYAVSIGRRSALFAFHSPGAANRLSLCIIARPGRKSGWPAGRVGSQTELRYYAERPAGVV